MITVVLSLGAVYLLHLRTANDQYESPSKVDMYPLHRIHVEGMLCLLHQAIRCSTHSIKTKEPQ